MWNMKKILMAMVMLAFGIPLGHAEPLSFEQAANVTGSNGGFQLGAGYSYGSQNVPQGDTPAISRFYSNVPIFARLGFPGFEIRVAAPYSSIASNIQEHGLTDVQGFRNIDLGAKFNALLLPFMDFGVGAGVVLPTIDANQYLYGEGLAVTPFAALDILTDPLLFHFNLGYTYVSQYQRATPNGETTIAFRPGDEWHYGVGVEVAPVEPLWILAEFSGTYYGQAKSAGDFVSSSGGNIMSFFPGLRLQCTPLKAKAGVEIPLTPKANRPAFVPNYDWRLMGEVSLLVPFGSTSAQSKKGGY
jgi:opacity protein-like surface antigen